MDNVPEWLVPILKEMPTLLVVLLVVWYGFKRVMEEHEMHLKSKDAEIERLVKEKNELQELVLKQRLSTQKPKK